MADARRLVHSHDELREALIVAGKRIRQLNFGRSDDPVLKLLRQALVIPVPELSEKHGT